MPERNEHHATLTSAYQGSRKAMIEELDALVEGASAMAVDDRLSDQEQARWIRRLARLSGARALLVADGEENPQS